MRISAVSTSAVVTPTSTAMAAIAVIIFSKIPASAVRGFIVATLTAGVVVTTAWAAAVLVEAAIAAMFAVVAPTRVVRGWWWWGIEAAWFTVQWPRWGRVPLRFIRRGAVAYDETAVGGLVVVVVVMVMGVVGVATSVAAPVAVGTCALALLLVGDAFGGRRRSGLG